MTVVVGIKTKTGVLLASDSRGTSPDFEYDDRADQKLFRLSLAETAESILFGGSGSFRAIQLLQYNLVLPAIQKREPFEWLVTSVIPLIKKLLDDNNIVEDDGTNFIVGFRKNLYIIMSDLQIAQPSTDYCAIGNGNSVALGSLYSTKTQSSRYRATLAIEAAAAHVASVGGPIQVIE